MNWSTRIHASFRRKRVGVGVLRLPGISFVSPRIKMQIYDPQSSFSCSNIRPRCLNGIRFRFSEHVLQLRRHHFPNFQSFSRRSSLKTLEMNRREAQTSTTVPSLTPNQTHVHTPGRHPADFSRSIVTGFPFVQMSSPSLEVHY